jgi:hypothetical protein
MNVTPRKRVIRTIVQVVVGVCAAIPAAVASLGLSAADAAAITGVAGAVTIIVSAAWNAIDNMHQDV